MTPDKMSDALGDFLEEYKSENNWWLLWNKS